MTALSPSVRLKELLGSWFQSVCSWFQSVFCIHKYFGVSNNRYDVISKDDGAKKGEVTLLVIRCHKCGTVKVIPTDRTYLQPN